MTNSYFSRWLKPPTSNRFHFSWLNWLKLHFSWLKPPTSKLGVGQRYIAWRMRGWSSPCIRSSSIRDDPKHMDVSKNWGSPGLPQNMGKWGLTWINPKKRSGVQYLRSHLSGFILSDLVYPLKSIRSFPGATSCSASFLQSWLGNPRVYSFFWPVFDATDATWSCLAQNLVPCEVGQCLSAPVLAGSTVANAVWRDSRKWS